MMQPSVHATFSSWSGVLFFVFYKAERLSGDPDDRLIRVGEIFYFIKCIQIDLANDISCTVDICI